MTAQVFNCNQIENIINFSLDASKEAYKLPLALWGLAGVGKTEFVTQIAQKRGYNLVVLHLATQGDICDLIGMPKTVEIKDEHGKVLSTSTTWACPEWLNNAIENSKVTGKPNLFFLDEFNRGNRFVLSAMLPFLIEGKLHTHRVNKEDAIICAMNPPTDAYEVNTISDEALINRVGHCIFKPTDVEYIEYLKRTGMDEITINVLKKNPEFMRIKDFKLDFDVTPSRRSIDHVMKIVGKKPPTWINEYGPSVIECYLGEKFKDDWITEFSKKDFSITIDMLKDYDNNAEYITKALTTKIEGVKTERIDIIGKILDNIKLWLDDNEDTLTVTDINWMFKFFNNPMVPAETCASIFKTHKFFINKMHTDKHLNVAIFNYLVKKGIITNQTMLTEWSKP
jgi:hypothetical protein